MSELNPNGLFFRLVDNHTGLVSDFFAGQIVMLLFDMFFELIQFLVPLFKISFELVDLIGIPGNFQPMTFFKLVLLFYRLLQAGLQLGL
jgi:hypothetical protein